MLYKSNSFYSSAQELRDSGFLCPSAHLAYYSVFIILKYIVCNYLGINYEVQDEEHSGGMSHKDIIEKVIYDVDAKNPDLSFDLERYINAMKQLRVKADYKDEEIDEPSIVRHLTNAQNVYDIVKPLYGIPI